MQQQYSVSVRQCEDKTGVSSEKNCSLAADETKALIFELKAAKALAENRCEQIQRDNDDLRAKLEVKEGEIAQLMEELEEWREMDRERLRLESKAAVFSARDCSESRNSIRPQGRHQVGVRVMRHYQAYRVCATVFKAFIDTYKLSQYKKLSTMLALTSPNTSPTSLHQVTSVVPTSGAHSISPTEKESRSASPRISPRSRRPGSPHKSPRKTTALVVEFDDNNAPSSLMEPPAGTTGGVTEEELLCDWILREGGPLVLMLRQKKQLQGLTHQVLILSVRLRVKLHKARPTPCQSDMMNSVCELSGEPDQDVDNTQTLVFASTYSMTKAQRKYWQEQRMAYLARGARESWAPAALPVMKRKLYTDLTCRATNLRKSLLYCYKNLSAHFKPAAPHETQREIDDLVFQHTELRALIKRGESNLRKLELSATRAIVAAHQTTGCLSPCNTTKSPKTDAIETAPPNQSAGCTTAGTLINHQKDDAFSLTTRKELFITDNGENTATHTKLFRDNENLLMELKRMLPKGGSFDDDREGVFDLNLGWLGRKTNHLNQRSEPIQISSLQSSLPSAAFLREPTANMGSSPATALTELPISSSALVPEILSKHRRMTEMERRFPWKGVLSVDTVSKKIRTKRSNTPDLYARQGGAGIECDRDPQVCCRRQPVTVSSFSLNLMGENSGAPRSVQVPLRLMPLEQDRKARLNS